MSSVRASFLCLLLCLSATAAASEIEKGKSVYRAHCHACHAPTNVMVSSPKAGDVAAWKERLAEGLESATDKAVAGTGAMPPKGGAAGLTREEIRAAIRYMAAPQP